MKKLLYGISGIALLLVSVFFIWVINYLISSEVMPAVRNGSLNVETNTMILNIVWEGNEIYILLATYALAAIAAAYGSVRLLKTAFVG
ncbi:MAG: hypothetical protein QNI99_04380 [Woeseiaceae bacterium]|nr:hypothetical protein [Woeseiaceae bacterium]